MLLAFGGIYTEASPIRDRDVPTLYWRLILNVIGIADVTFVSGGGAMAVDLQEQKIDAFVAQLRPQIRHAAAA